MAAKPVPLEQRNAWTYAERVMAWTQLMGYSDSPSLYTAGSRPPLAGSQIRSPHGVNTPTTSGICRNLVCFCQDACPHEPPRGAAVGIMGCAVQEAELHELLTGPIYATTTASNVVTITEGRLNREQMAALACVADAFSVACELKYAMDLATPAG